MAIDTATGKEAPAEISSERVKDIFSTIAKKYERFNAISSFGAYKMWLAGMMKQAPISANDDVLDIAGGTGDVSFTVARAKHPRHIQCTDLVNEMLDVARAHYADGAADGVPPHECARRDGGTRAQDGFYAAGRLSDALRDDHSAHVFLPTVRARCRRCIACSSRAAAWCALSSAPRPTPCGGRCITFI
mgnify:CR=1 FL=1